MENHPSQNQKWNYLLIFFLPELIFLVTLVLGLALATLATIDVANSNAATDKKKRGQNF
jgi:hypothetical protein